MVDLTAVSDLAEILSAVAVVGGIWFAVIQLREYRTQRRDAATFELMRAFAEPEFARAVRLVRGLPDDVSAVATWLSAQPVPAEARPVAAAPGPWPLDCGSGTK